MLDTSASLLQRLRDRPHDEDWDRMVALYTPLIRGWLRKQQLLPDDADDMVQDVMLVVVRRLTEFEHNQRTGAFRTWLKTITVNCLRNVWKKRKAATSPEVSERLDQLEDPNSGLSKAWDDDHDKHVTRQLLEQLRPQFEPATWEAFRRVSLDGQPANDVAAALGISVNAVYIAKSRVLTRLRQEAAGLLEA